MLLYFISYIDRVNIGFAALTMNKDLGFTSSVFGFGAGIFFIGYFLFEVPSNIILEKVGARLWIARVMITWGIISAAFAFIQGEVSLCFSFFAWRCGSRIFPGHYPLSKLLVSREAASPGRLVLYGCCAHFNSSRLTALERLAGDARGLGS
jgi:MFS family permease